MHNLCRLLIAGCLLLLVAPGVSAQEPLLAKCTRSANVLACVDAQGNAYSVLTAGNTIYLRGFEVSGRRSWAQTNSRYGQLTFSRDWLQMAKLGLDTVVAWAGRLSIVSPALGAALGDSCAGESRAARIRRADVSRGTTSRGG